MTLISRAGLILALALTTFATAATAQDFREMKFYREELSPKTSFKTAIDPIGGGKVQMMVLDPTQCVDADCRTNSRRALMHEDIYKGRAKGKNGQPKAAWYGWDIFFPGDFPSGSRQAKAGLMFTEFKHTSICASMKLAHQPGYDDDDLNWQTAIYTGASPDNVAEECKTIRSTRVARLRDLVGRWTRFELFVNWSREADGEVKLFVNGEQKVQYNGITCYEDCFKFNPFYYGIYMSNARSVESIRETFVLFKNVDRAATREELDR